MNDPLIDRILENLLHILPLFHKKLLRMDLGGVTGHLTRLHLATMGMLHEGNMPVSDLANTLTIRKSQMTLLIDQLVRLGIVERLPDARDRRVINLTLTPRGQVLLGDMKRKVQENIKEKLAGLTPEELAAMLEALDTLRKIGARL